MGYTSTKIMISAGSLMSLVLIYGSLVIIMLLVKLGSKLFHSLVKVYNWLKGLLIFNFIITIFIESYMVLAVCTFLSA